MTRLVKQMDRSPRAERRNRESGENGRVSKITFRRPEKRYNKKPSRNTIPFETGVLPRGPGVAYALQQLKLYTPLSSAFRVRRRVG